MEKKLNPSDFNDFIQNPDWVRAYLTGRMAIPPWLQAKKSRPFGFQIRQTIADGVSAVAPIQIHDDAHFLVEQIQAISSAQDNTQDKITAQITDTTSSTSWSNTAVPLRDFAGDGRNPKNLSDPNILRPSSTVQVQLTNNSGGAVTVYGLLNGRKVYGLTKPEVDFLTRRMWFQYVISCAIMTAGQANVDTKLNIYNESDFLLKRLSSQQMLNTILGLTAGTESSEMLIQLRDSVSDVNLFDAQVAARLIFGAGQAENAISAQAAWQSGKAFELRKPWLLRRNGQVVSTMTNLANASSTAFALVLEGARMFDPV